MRKNTAFFGLGALLFVAVFLFGCLQPQPPVTPTATPVANPLENACTASGGLVSTSTCCGSVGDFPNTCLIGACGCAPANSHEVRVCACGEGKCFDGTGCVLVQMGGEPTATPGLVGNDTDEHGCIGSAGYTWCESKQKCIRSWEENCSGMLVGNDTDSHRCIGSAGYVWCVPKEKCLRLWEENCTGSPLENKAREFCGGERIAKVYVCGPFIRTVSTLMGGGSTFYDANGTVIAACPLVAPDSMSEQCRLLLLGNDCAEQEVC